MKRTCITFLLIILAVISVRAKDYMLSTQHTTLVISAEMGSESTFKYYGPYLDSKDTIGLWSSGTAFKENSYPVFGLNTYSERAMAVKQADGNLTLDLKVESVESNNGSEGSELVIILKDAVYPFKLRQYFKAYSNTDVISTWVEAENIGKKPITLYKYASAFIPLRKGDNYITHFHGDWGSEDFMQEEKLTNGQKIISDKDGLANAGGSNPCFMITMDGAPCEESGDVFGGTLAWSGNYLIKAIVTNLKVNISAGINEDMSQYILEGGEKFKTPEFAMTYSRSGKGGVSRAFHRWARLYKIHDGTSTRDILLNSWEGVYFKVSQEAMDSMMKDFSAMGGELFVMDDGWFGNKYPRNRGNSSLGDWEVCKEKLPNGIEGLLESAKKYGIKFGLWIEPEMSNTKSELFEKHPDWILKAKNRSLSTGRGGTQIVLDLANPEVQDFVFSVVDNLMTKYPNIAYMKWDCNSSLMDYGSQYLPADKQSHIYVDYHLGLKKVLERIRAKYPDLVMQACAGGGWRINYGLLPYFNEFWTSDDTDALQRIYIQWGVSNFYPAGAMAAHVSAERNHQTHRVLPLKFRFDVAMSGRLGMEIQPRDMSEQDKEYAARCIASYKQVRQIIQQGDLYRLISPYDHRGVSSLMYTNEDKSEAVFFAYKLEHFINMTVPYVRLSGLDPDRSYTVKDLSPVKASEPCSLDGQKFTGRFLMEVGLNLAQFLKTEYSSMALQLK